MDRIGYPIHDVDPNAPTGSTARVVLIVLGVTIAILGLIAAWILSELTSSFSFE